MKIGKRILSLALSAVMLMSMFTMVIGISASAATVWDGTTAESFSSGDGTAENPYIIMSGSELALMASNINSGIGNGAYYKLGADIVLNENVLDENYNKNSGTFTKWNAIGDGTYVAIPDEITSQDEYDQAKATYGTLYYYYNSSRYFAGYNSNYTTYYYQTLFTGSFDGDNHTISGIYMGDWDSGKSHGLFGYVFGATIKNLRIKDSYSVSNNNDGGGVLAVFLKGTDWQNYMTVDNVQVDGRTNLCVDPKNMGLFSSYAQYVNFTNCVAYGLSANPLTTGKVGGNYSGFTAATDGVNFTNCVNYADVNAGTTGGFVARAKTTVFTDCINYGNISCTSYGVDQWKFNGTNEYGMAGGFIGGIETTKTVTFTRCLNEGAVTGKTYAGGFIGKSLSTNTKTYKNSFNKAAVIVTEEKADVLSANSNLTETDIVCVSGGIFGNDRGTTTNWSISDTTYDMSGCEVAGTCSDGTAAVTTGDTVTYQSGSWLDDTTLWTIKAGQNPTLKLVAPAEEHTHSYTDEVTAPTCTEKGYTTHTCECGDSYVDNYTEPTGHTYDEGVVTKAATCTETGVMTYTCVKGDDSYTEVIPVIDHDYDNGICKVCGAASETAPLQVSAASITLQSNIQANYKVNKNLFETAGYSAPYMTFTLNGKTTRVDECVPEGNYYVFRFSDIAPDKMNDTITSVLYATKGETVEQIQNEYSIATYCYNQLAKEEVQANEKLRTLLVDMLNYGAASQTYTGYNTANLVNAALSAEQKGWETSAAPTLTDSLNTAAKTVENATATWIGAALRLTDRVEMKFILDTASIEGLTVKFTNAAGNVEYATVASDAFEERTAGGYYVYFDGFDASQMSEVVYVTAYKDGVAVSNTIAYSVETYACAKQNSSVPNLSNLVIAMMKYGNAAKAYASV